MENDQQPTTTQDQQVSSGPPPVVNTPIDSGAGGFAITALVMGIVSFVLGWTGVLGLVLAIIAVLFGVLGLVKHQNKVMSIFGVVLGGLALLTALFVTLVFTLAIFSSANENTNSGSSSNSSSWDAAEAYTKVQTGMSKSEVEDAINKTDGDCSEYSSDTFGKSETCTYGDVINDNGTITVTYDNGKVNSKSKYLNK